MALVNLLTNPAVVLLSVLIPRYSAADISYGALVAALELLAWLTESPSGSISDTVSGILPRQPRMSCFTTGRSIN